MAKHWWFKFDFRVWRNDSDLQQCSLEARGFWLEMLCVMYEQDTFQVSGSVQQIARLARCDSGEVVRISLELKNANVCDVTLGNGSVTLLSRRLKRNVTDREQTRLRVQKYRGNGDVTAQSKKKEVISKKKEEEGGSGEPQNRATRSRGQTQDEWLSVIKSNPIYAHIDIDRELGKSQVWIDDHPGRKLTKQFFLNWINKIDPPLNGNGHNPPTGGCDTSDKAPVDSQGYDCARHSIPAKSLMNIPHRFLNVETREALAAAFSISLNSEGPRGEAGFRRFPSQITQPAEPRGLFLCQK